MATHSILYLVGTKFVEWMVADKVLREFRGVLCCLALDKIPAFSVGLFSASDDCIRMTDPHACLRFCSLSPRALSFPCSEAWWLPSLIGAGRLVPELSTPSSPMKRASQTSLSGASCSPIKGSSWGRPAPVTAQAQSIL